MFKFYTSDNPGYYPLIIIADIIFLYTHSQLNGTIRGRIVAQHSSDGDKIHSYCLYLVTEHVEHLEKKNLKKNLSLLSVTDFLAPFCIHAAKFVKTCIVNYVTAYWFCDCCSKKLYK